MNNKEVSKDLRLKKAESMGSKDTMQKKEMGVREKQIPIGESIKSSPRHEIHGSVLSQSSKHRNQTLTITLDSD